MNDINRPKADNELIAKQPRMVTALDRFSHQIEHSDKIIISIKNKLHLLSDWRNPDNADIKEQPSVNCESAMDQLESHIERQTSLNDRLGDILRHLQNVI